MPVPIPPRPSHTALDEGAPDGVVAPLAAVSEEGARIGEAVSQQASALFSGIAAQFSRFPSLPPVNVNITASAEAKRPLDERLHEELLYRYRAQRASTSLAASKLLEREVSVANSAVPAYSNTSKELHAIKESLGSVHVAIMTVAGKAGSARQAAAGLLASEPALPSGDASSSSSVLD